MDIINIFFFLLMVYAFPPVLLYLGYLLFTRYCLNIVVSFTKSPTCKNMVIGIFYQAKSWWCTQLCDYHTGVLGWKNFFFPLYYTALLLLYLYSQSLLCQELLLRGENKTSRTAENCWYFLHTHRYRCSRKKLDGNSKTFFS